jgi:MFS family permease
MTLTETRILRLALGTTVAMALAQSVAWPFAFITPVFTAMFLAAPMPCPRRPAVILLVSSVLATGASGLALTLGLLPYPLAYVSALLLIYLRLFYAISGGANPFMVIMTLVGVTAIPVLGQVSANLALVFSVGFAFSGVTSILLVLLSHGLLPDPDAGTTLPVPQKKQAPLPSERRLRTAMISTAVVAPVALVFCFFTLTSELVTLIFILTLSLQPEIKAGIQASKKNIAGACVGGMISIVFYELLVVVPSFTFLILLTFGAMLVIGGQIYSGRPSAAVFAASISTFLIIVGGAIGSDDAEASAKFYLRVLQIMLAGFYVVVAFSAIESLFARRQRKTTTRLDPERVAG